ncbi:MAG: LamG domain-containing protein [Myxococcaceae bacterium]|jgi:hypothetical protein|nr:LamG domain-containing protein [Myxococcaceae bacterium]
MLRLAQVPLKRTVRTLAAALWLCAPVARAQVDGGRSDAAVVPSYGASPMVQVAPDVFVDPATTTDERARLATTVSESRTRLADVLGALQSPAPIAVFCKTDSCTVFFAGEERRSAFLVPGNRRPTNARYVPVRPTIVLVRADPGSGPTVVHELAHFELKTRLQGASVPVWFDEGLATFLGDNVKCPERTPRAIDDLSRLARDPAWWNYTNHRGAMGPTYCQARDELSRWVARHDRAQLVALIDAVAQGASFDERFGPLSTSRPQGRLQPIITTSTEMGDARRAFSLALWVKPKANVGVLAFLSETEIGTGWATPLLGFDSSGRLVSQVLFGNSGDPSSFSTAMAPRPLAIGVWSHVAMTWTPEGSNVLYVNGAEVGRVPAPKYLGDGAGRTMYVSWGTYNVGGIDAAWTGSITSEEFAGDVAKMRVEPAALSGAEVKALAKARP